MRLFKTSFRNRKGKIQSASKWYGEFTDHNERTRRLPLFTDKAASDEALRNIAKLVAYHRASGGQADPALLPWIENLPSRIKSRLLEIGLLDSRRITSAKTLSEHVNDYHASVTAKKTKAYADLCVARIGKVFKQCRFAYWSDMDAAAIEQALAAMQQGRTLPDRTVQPGITDQTRNAYLVNIKTFCRWMVLSGRATVNPVAHLQIKDVVTESRQRRALDAATFRRLLDAARAGPERYGIDGPQRAVIYQLAAETGLRCAEIASLTKASFDLGNGRVSLRASSTKNGKAANLPLRATMVELMRFYLAGKLPSAKAFPKLNREHSAEMLREDLTDADIPYTDDDNRVFDFHALRHQFISSLAAGGVHPKTAQELARHSRIDLTMNLYTHVFRGDLSGALDALPDYSAKPETQRATGTNDTSPDCGEKRLALCLAHQDGKQGYSGIRSGQAIASAQGEESPLNMQETLIYQGNGDDGTRTRNHRIDNPVL